MTYGLLYDPVAFLFIVNMAIAFCLFETESCHDAHTEPVLYYIAQASLELTTLPP